MSNINQKISNSIDTFIASLEEDASQNPVSEIIKGGLHEYQSAREKMEEEDDITRFRIALLELLIEETKKSAVGSIAKSTRRKAKKLLQLLYEREMDEGMDELRASLSLPISNLSNVVSNRVIRLLDKAGIHFIGDLIFRSEANLLALRGFGIKSLKEIKQEFMNHGMGIAKKRTKHAFLFYKPASISKADWKKMRKLL